MALSLVEVEQVVEALEGSTSLYEVICVCNQKAKWICL
jgi:hypothetical protein